MREVTVTEGKDNARDCLHESRFTLRPILEHPKKWFSQVKIKWPETIRNISLDFLGADLQINSRTIASRHDRSIYIEAKYLLPKNHNVEARPTITKSRMHGGKLEHVTEYDYQEPESLEDMLIAVTPGGTKVRLHVCAITTKMIRGEPVLCGKFHSATGCSKRSR